LIRLAIDLWILSIVAGITLNLIWLEHPRRRAYWTIAAQFMSLFGFLHTGWPWSDPEGNGEYILFGACVALTMLSLIGDYFRVREQHGPADEHNSTNSRQTA
jgi:hypothetical protein